MDFPPTGLTKNIFDKKYTTKQIKTNKKGKKRK